MLKNVKILIPVVVVLVIVGTVVIIRGTANNTRQEEDIDKESVSFDQRDPSASSGQSLPVGFPEDFPIYPEAKIESAFTSKGDEVKAMSVIWIASDSLDSVSAYYTSELARAGWIVNSTFEDESSVTLSFEKAGEQGFITAFKKTPDFQSGDELNADMSSSFGGNPAFQSGEDVIGIGKQDDGFVIISVTIGASFERPTI